MSNTRYPQSIINYLLSNAGGGLNADKRLDFFCTKAERRTTKGKREGKKIKEKVISNMFSEKTKCKIIEKYLARLLSKQKHHGCQ